MPKPLPPLAQLYRFTPTTRALSESSSVSWTRYYSVLSVTQAWAPPAQRCLHLFISQGKTTHGFSVAAGSAVVSAHWPLSFCLDKDAEEGHCAPLEVGSFATVFKWDSGIGIDHLFLLLFPSLFSVFFPVTNSRCFSMLQSSQIQNDFCNTIEASKMHLPHKKLFQSINQKGCFVYEFVVVFNQDVLLLGLV